MSRRRFTPNIAACDVAADAQQPGNGWHVEHVALVALVEELLGLVDRDDLGVL